MYSNDWSTEQIEKEISLKFSKILADQNTDQSIGQSENRYSGCSGDAGGRLVGMDVLLARLTDSLENQTLFRSEIRSLRDEVSELRRERVEERRTFREQIAVLENEMSGLRTELSRRRGLGDGIDFPPSSYLEQPLVISSNGKYLGVQGQGHSPFSLKDFIGLIENNASGQSVVETSWKKSNDNWVLVVHTEDQAAKREQNVILVTAKVKTPKNNDVTEIVRLNINGADAPDALLFSLFRQVRNAFKR